MMAYPDNKVYGANMGSIWGRQDPGGSHVGPMNFDILVASVGSRSFIGKVIFASFINMVKLR